MNGILCSLYFPLINDVKSMLLQSFIGKLIRTNDKVTHFLRYSFFFPRTSTKIMHASVPTEILSDTILNDEYNMSFVQE